MDFLCLLIGKKMNYRKAYRKTEKILIMMSFFGTREWNFRNENIQRLVERTKEFKYQRGNLDFDIRNIDWNQYFRNYIPGIKRYYFKEDCDNVKALEKSYQRWEDNGLKDPSEGLWSIKHNKSFVLSFRMKRLHEVVKYLFYTIATLTVLKSSKARVMKFVFKLIVK